MGEVGEGFYAEDAFEGEVGLEGEPAGEVVGGDWGVLDGRDDGREDVG